MRTEKYDFGIVCTKGSLMQISDTLSWAALKDNTPEIADKEMNCYVHLGMSSITKFRKTYTAT